MQEFEDIQEGSKTDNVGGGALQLTRKLDAGCQRKWSQKMNKVRYAITFCNEIVSHRKRDRLCSS